MGRKGQAISAGNPKFQALWQVALVTAQDKRIESPTAWFPLSWQEKKADEGTRGAFHTPVCGVLRRKCAKILNYKRDIKQALRNCKNITCNY
jgi:hypothetical protein